MKKLVYANLLVLAIAALVTTSAATVVTEGSTVTGTAQGIFPAGSTLGGVTTDSLQLATGVIIDPSSSAAGHFHALLKGNTLLGTPQEITVEGKVMQGSRDETGAIRFTGIATLGDGAALRTGVPFSVAIKPGSLTLTIGETSLPATLIEGSMSLE